jgi:isoleucyl-tRNA synthetase
VLAPGSLVILEDERTIWNVLIRLREVVLPELEKARQLKLIGKSLEARLTLKGTPQAIAVLSPAVYREALRELLNVSQLEIETLPEGAPNEHRLDWIVSKAAGQKCERCWHWETDVGSNPEHPTICARCVAAVKQFKA